MMENIKAISEAILENLGEDELKNRLSYPDSRPADFDISLEAWLYRLSVSWGVVTIYYDDPENGVKNKVVTKDKFLEITDNEEDKKVYGLWNVTQEAIDKIILHRTYLAFDGKRYKEQFTVKIKLKGSLQKVLTKNIGIFKWFKF